MQQTCRAGRTASRSTDTPAYLSAWYWGKSRGAPCIQEAPDQTVASPGAFLILSELADASGGGRAIEALLGSFVNLRANESGCCKELTSGIHIQL